MYFATTIIIDDIELVALVFEKIRFENNDPNDPTTRSGQTGHSGRYFRIELSRKLIQQIRSRQ